MSLPRAFIVATPTPEISELVQKKLFAMGRQWNNEGEKIQFTDKPYLFTYPEGDDGICYGDNPKGYCGQELISLEDFFSAPIPPKTRTVTGILPWDVEIGEKEVKVGCQTFRKNDFELLLQAGQKFESFAVGGIKVRLGREGLMITVISDTTCSFVSWADFDKFVEEFKK